MSKRNKIDADIDEDEEGNCKIRFYYKNKCYVSYKYYDEDEERYYCKLWDETNFNNKIDLDYKKAYDLKQHYSFIDNK